MTPLTACPNCEQRFGVPPPNFCPQCGQEATIEPPTLREFAQQFGGAYISTEGALWRTLKLLVLKPGELSREYFAGRRRRYVLPLRLYLTVSVIALVITRLTGGLGLSDADDPAIAAAVVAHPGFVGFDLDVARVGQENGVFVCESLPPWVCRQLQTRINFEPAAVLARLHAVQDRVTSNWSAVMFVLVPAFAAGLNLLFRNRKLFYTEHLVVALHLHAFWFIVLAVSRIGGVLAQGLAPLAIVIYGVMALRHVYDCGWPAAAVRGMILAVLYSSLLLVVMVAFALAVLLT